MPHTKRGVLTAGTYADMDIVWHVLSFCMFIATSYQELSQVSELMAQMTYNWECLGQKGMQVGCGS